MVRVDAGKLDVFAKIVAPILAKKAVIAGNTRLNGNSIAFGTVRIACVVFVYLTYRA